jgi:tetratricopeptide (TPR) repeat protein
MKQPHMRKLLPLYFSLLYTWTVTAQINTDSLKTVLSKEIADSATIAKYLTQMESLQTTEQEPYLVIGNWALTNATKLNNKYLMALSNVNLGFIVISTSVDFITSTRYFTAAQSIAETNHFKDIEAKALNGLAHIYSLNGQNDKFEDYTLKSFAISEEIGSLDGVAVGYANLSNSYFVKRRENPQNLAKAISYMLLAIQTGENTKDTFSLIATYMSISRMYSEEKKFDSARYYLNRSAAYIEGSKREVDYNRYYYYEGSLFHQQGKYPDAINNYRSSIKYSNKFNIPTYVITTYKAMTKTYKAMGDYKNALYYTEITKKYDDSVLSKENFAAAADIQNKYQREKKDNELLQKDLALKTSGARRNKLLSFLVSSLVMLVLLGVFTALLIRNIRAKKKAYTELQKRNEEIKEKAIQLSQQARLIAKFQSQMNPHFTFNALHNIYGLVISHENDKAVSQIQSLAQLMRKTLTNSVKEEITLEEEMDYLQKYIDFEQATAPAKVDFTIEVDKELENALIPPMMIQPFIENSIKHAELDKVKDPFIKVMISKEEDLMRLIIEDNGKGLNKENTNINTLSHSISIIRSRIELLFPEKNSAETDRFFNITSVPGIRKGTTIKFYLPLNYAF